MIYVGHKVKRTSAYETYYCFEFRYFKTKREAMPYLKKKIGSKSYAKVKSDIRLKVNGKNIMNPKKWCNC